MVIRSIYDICLLLTATYGIFDKKIRWPNARVAYFYYCAYVFLEDGKREIGRNLGMKATRRIVDKNTKHIDSRYTSYVD